jgi:hypothetical protein
VTINDNIQKDNKMFEVYNEMNPNNATLFLKKRIENEDIIKFHHNIAIK